MNSADLSLNPENTTAKVSWATIRQEGNCKRRMRWFSAALHLWQSRYLIPALLRRVGAFLGSNRRRAHRERTLSVHSMRNSRERRATRQWGVAHLCRAAVRRRITRTCCMTTVMRHDVMRDDMLGTAWLRLSLGRGYKNLCSHRVIAATKQTAARHPEGYSYHEKRSSRLGEK
jgi:hypothetical protein